MTTPILELEEWTEAQAQPHVTVNEAVRWLECFASLSVLSQATSTPPGSPAEGDRYIVGPGASGVWSGHDAEIALYFGTAWDFRAAPNGAIAYVEDEELPYRLLSGVWTVEPSGGGGGSGSQPYMLTASILTAYPTAPRFQLAVGGHITHWAVHAEGGPGDCQLDVRRSTAGAANPPAPEDSICASAFPFLAGEVGRDEAPSGDWFLDLEALDVIEIVLTSVDTNITAVHFQLLIEPPS